MNTIKIGMSVVYSGAWGYAPNKSATIVGMTLTDEPRSKYGKTVKEVTVEDVKANKVLFDLSDEHWCYANQIRGINMVDKPTLVL